MRRPPLMLMGAMFVMWLLLNNSLSAGHSVLGALLAVLLGWASMSMRPLQPRLHRLHLAVKLIFVVLFDILRSNIAVGRIILGIVPREQVQSGFLDIPLELHDPHGLAVLATIVTSTPGTIWATHDEQTSTLTLHVLDLKDEEGWIRTIKDRYEQPLIGIFQ